MNTLGSRSLAVIGFTAGLSIRWAGAGARGGGEAGRVQPSLRGIGPEGLSRGRGSPGRF